MALPNPLQAANYLDIPPLVDLLCNRLASLVQGQTIKQMRLELDIKNDFTSEEVRWCGGGGGLAVAVAVAAAVAAAAAVVWQRLRCGSGSGCGVAVAAADARVVPAVRAGEGIAQGEHVGAQHCVTTSPRAQVAQERHSCEGVCNARLAELSRMEARINKSAEKADQLIQQLKTMMAAQLAEGQQAADRLKARDAELTAWEQSVKRHEAAVKARDAELTAWEQSVKRHEAAVKEQEAALQLLAAQQQRRQRQFGSCTNCGGPPKLHMCTLCHDAMYCGATCQATHWRESHRAACARSHTP